MTRDPAHLTPQEVQDSLADGSILLIDVREPLEFAQARIPGAFLFPLSTFDARFLPASGDRRLVFYCQVGVRSQKALAHARNAGLNAGGHLEGGMAAWISAGYEFVETNPETGRPRIVKVG